MDIHHQAPDEVVVTEMSPTHSNGVEVTKEMTESERLPVTIRYSTFRLPGYAVQTSGDSALTAGQSLAALKLEAQAKAKANYEEAEAQFEEGKRFYRVDPDQWAAAEAQWREWVTKRDPGSPALESGRLHVSLDARASWRQKELDGAVSEARFSEVLEPQHGTKCITCEAMRITEEDPTLGDAEKLHRITRLAHKVPRLQTSSSAGRVSPVKASSDFSGKISEELSASTWGHERAEPVQKQPTPSIVESLKNSLPKPEILDLELGSRIELSHRREFLDATKQLLRSTSDAAMFDAMMLDPTLLLRACVFHQNKQTVENAIDTLNAPKGLGAADRKSIARTTAEVWELERDLLKLEGIQQALGVRKEWAKVGYSVNKYNFRVARMRRENYADVESHPLGYGRLGFARGLHVDHEDEKEKDPEEEEEEKSHSATKSASTETDNALQLQERLLVEVPAQSDAVELNTEPKRSPSPLDTANSPEQRGQTLQEGPTQSTRGTSLFLNTLHNFHKHNLEAAQNDSKSPSTEVESFKYDAEQQTLPTTGEAATSSNDVPNINASKGKAKKDSKVEELIEEDGVSLKDFAAKSDEKKSKGLRKLSIKAGSSRPKWR